MSFPTITRSPGLRLANKVLLTAAIPLEKAVADSASSKSAIFSSRICTVGFVFRPYICPSLSPFATAAAALVPVAQKAEEYYLKQRDRTDTIEANKVRIEIKSKADEIIGREKNNIDEFNSVNNFSTDYDNFLKTKLDSIQNKRVKTKVENSNDENIDLKPKPEKISQDHLDQIQRLVQSVNSIQYNVGKLESQKHTLLHNLSLTQDRIGVFQDVLKKEYGTFDVNIEDGIINYSDKDTDNEE